MPLDLNSPDVSVIARGAGGASAPAPTVIDEDPYYYYVTSLVRGRGDPASTVLADDAGNQWATNGDAQVQNNQLALDGTGDYLSSTLQEGILGTADLTIEARVTPTSFTNPGEILCVSNASLSLSTFTLVWEYTTTGAVRFSLQNGAGTPNVDLSTAAGALTLNVEKHVACTVEGTTVRIRIDGVVVATGSITGTRADNQLAARIGYLTSDLANAHQRFFSGRIRDLRVTRGVCRYPGNTTITPPAANVPHFPAPKLLATFSNPATTQDAQGVCTDGVNVWTSSSNTLYKWTRAGALVTSRSIAGDAPATGKTNALGGPQCNGLYIRNGVLYVSVAQYLSNTPTSWICEYDPTTLTLQQWRLLPSYGFSEGLAWGQGYWWVAFHADMRVAQYDASWNLVAEHFIDQTVTGSSGGYGPGTGYDGIAWSGNLLYLNIHETYTQKYLDVFAWNGKRFTRVHRQRRCSPIATQGLCINPADPTEMWLALRNYSGDDQVARAALVP